MNFSGYVGHVTIFRPIVECSLLRAVYSSRDRVRIMFIIWLVSGYAHVFVPLSVVMLKF